MPGVLNNAAIYLISTLFDLYLFVLLIRLILAATFANYFDPLTQFITKLTNPLVKPIRTFIPNIGRFETASAILILLLELIKFAILLFLTMGTPNVLGLFILALGDGLKLVLQVFFYAIIIQALLSFIQPRSPLTSVLHAITTPILRPFQRLIPPVSGVDLSPIPALVLLQLFVLILANPMIAFGMGMAAT